MPKIERKEKAPLQNFPRFIEARMHDWKVPGAAVVVAKDGQVVLCEGFGQRDRKERLPVTEHTLFPLASVTKAFTTTGMAILADEGKLDWDTPVKHYMPDFRLYDPMATERITPRDLVTHRSGLPRHDLAWYHSSASREELLKRLQYLRPNKDFRSTYQYNNLMYMTAGILSGRLTGGTWEDVVQSRIFNRLAMVSSNFSIRESAHTADVARPYKKNGAKVRRIPYYEDQEAVSAAGALVSNVADMSSWLLLQLNQGRHGRRQIVSKGQLAQLHGPQMVVSQPSRWAEVLPGNYGLGWMVQAYRGHRFIQHGGNIDGFSTLIAFLPDANVGTVVLTNLSGNLLPFVLTWTAFDRLLGLDEIDWNGRLLQESDEMEVASKTSKARMQSRRVAGTKLSHPLSSYLGEYEHPGYGVLRIERQGSNLKALYNSLNFPLTRYHYDIFELFWELFDVRMKVSFSTGVQGDIDAVSVPFEENVEAIVFRRVPPKEMRERSFLKQFCGQYSFLGRPLRVSLKGDDVLLASIPFYPTYELEPRKGMEFLAKGAAAIEIEFKKDRSGKVTEAIVASGFGVFSAPKQGSAI